MKIQNNTQNRKLHCVWIPRGVYQIRRKAVLGEYILPNQGLVGSVHDGRRVWLLNPIEEQQIQKSWKYAIIQLQFVDKPESLTNVQNVLYYWCTIILQICFMVFEVTKWLFVFRRLLPVTHWSSQWGGESRRPKDHPIYWPYKWDQDISGEENWGCRPCNCCYMLSPLP